MQELKTYAVWKYPLVIDDLFEIVMPYGAKILHVDTQYGTPYLWALCNTQETVSERRRFRLAGTGHPIRLGFVGEQPTYIGSFQMRDGALVFHLFERSPEDDAESI